MERITKNKFIVVMIDELESLFTSDKKNFHLMIDFLNIKIDFFVKICISNALNLFVSTKNQNLFLNYNFLIFKPYKFKTICRIIDERLKSLKNSKIPP